MVKCLNIGKNIGQPIYRSISNSDAFKNDVNCCFHPAVSFSCVFFVIERKKSSIYLHFHPNTTQQLQIRWAGFKVLKCRNAVVFSLELHSGRLNQSYAIAPHWSNRSIAGSHIRSCEIKRLLNKKNICWQIFLSIMSTNHCSPIFNGRFVEHSVGRL